MALRHPDRRLDRMLSLFRHQHIEKRAFSRPVLTVSETLPSMYTAFSLLARFFCWVFGTGRCGFACSKHTLPQSSSFPSLSLSDKELVASLSSRSVLLDQTLLLLPNGGLDIRSLWLEPFLPSEAPGSDCCRLPILIVSLLCCW